MHPQILSILLLAGQLSPSVASNDQSSVVAGAISHSDRLQQLPGIDIEWRAERAANPLPQSSESFAFSWLEAHFILRPREQGKVFMKWKVIVKTEDGKDAIRITEESSDKQYHMMQNLPSDKRKGMAMSVISMLDRATDANFSTRGLYFRALGFPVVEKPDAGTAKRRIFPDGAYWLPEALRRFGREYTLLPQQEIIDGVGCQVLERKGLDKIWIDSAMGYVIRKRQFTWGPGNGLRSDCLFREFQEVAPNTWLPKLIVWDWYAAPWDEPLMRGKIASTLHIKVSRLQVSEVPETTFRLKIPVGANVLDNVSNPNSDKPNIFINHGESDPFEVAIAGAYRNQSSKWIWIVILVVCCAVAIAFLVRIELMRRKSNINTGD